MYGILYYYNMLLYQPLFTKHAIAKSKGKIIREGHTSPFRSLGNTNDTQINAGLYTKDKISQNQEKKNEVQEIGTKNKL